MTVDESHPIFKQLRDMLSDRASGQYYTYIKLREEIPVGKSQDDEARGGMLDQEDKNNMHAVARLTAWLAMGQGRSVRSWKNDGGWCAVLNAEFRLVGSAYGRESWTDAILNALDNAEGEA